MRGTIFALVTAPGRSAVAIVRVSGPEAKNILARLCKTTPAARLASLKTIFGGDGVPIDKALVLWFPGPKSFTGEDVFELQLHGGTAIISAVAEALLNCGASPAEPGEFTRRAFEAGRLDLSQAEAIADLVDAETEAQRRQALAQLDGALTQRGNSWRDILLTALAYLEAQIDFPDEEVPPDIAAEARAPLTILVSEIDAILTAPRGEQIREGVKIALVGAPNAGKSSLLNALLGRSAAIVAAQPGTTRDVIEAPLVIAGYKALVADTAGIRVAEDEVEIEGVRRAKAWADAADLRLWIVDPQAPPDDLRDMMRPGDLLVSTKSDLISENVQIMPFSKTESLVAISSSVVTPGGLQSLWMALEMWVTAHLSGADFPVVTQMRHRMLLVEASDHLHRALSRPLGGAELMAEDVRLAARSLERLSGRLNPEDVLDRVFSAFCIGK